MQKVTHPPSSTSTPPSNKKRRVSFELAEHGTSTKVDSKSVARAFDEGEVQLTELLEVVQKVKLSTLSTSSTESKWTLSNVSQVHLP